MTRTRTLYELRFPNGKRYLGITARPLRTRLHGHFNSAARGSMLRVHRAIRKYGLGQVTINPLCIGPAGYIAELEVLAIARYRTREAANGYNVALGGDDSPILTPGIIDAIKATKRKTVARRSALAKAAHARPDTKERHRAAVVAAHARPSVKEGHTAAVRIAAAKSGRRAAISAAQTTRWQSADARNAARLAGQAQWRDPAVRARNLAGLRSAQSSDDARENHREAAFAMHADPEFKERHRAGALRGQRARRERERLAKESTR